MAKYFKATIQPKKSFINSNPEEAIELVLASGDYNTQAEFKEALVAMLDEEGVSANYFAPKVEKCSQEEHDAINSDDEDDGEGEGFEDCDGTFNIVNGQGPQESEGKTITDIISFFPGMEECEDSINSTIDSFVNGTLPEQYANITKQQTIEWICYLAETCQCQVAEVMNVRLLRRLFESTYGKERVNNEPHKSQEFAPAEQANVAVFDEHDDGEVIQGTGEIINDDPSEQVIYRWFEFEKGFPAILKSEFDIFSGKWIGSFCWIKESPIVMRSLEKRFKSDENAAINAMGALINHMTDIKNAAQSNGIEVGTWYNTTIKGLSGNGERRLADSLISKSQAEEILGQVDIEEITGERLMPSGPYRLPKDHIDSSSEGTTIIDSTVSEELKPEMPAKIQPVIDALMAHQDYKNQKGIEHGNNAYVHIVSAHIGSILGEADESDIEQAIETIGTMRTIGHLVKLDECVSAFEIIIDDEITQTLTPKAKIEIPAAKKGQQAILSFPCTFDAIAKVCERYKQEPRVMPKVAFDALMKCVVDSADDKMIADHIMAKVKNPHVFLGVGAMQLAMTLNCNVKDESSKADKKPLSSKLAAKFGKKNDAPEAKKEENKILEDGYPEKLFKAGEKTGENGQFEAVELTKQERADYVESQKRQETKDTSEAVTDEADSFDWVAGLQEDKEPEKPETEISELDRQVAELNEKLAKLKPGEVLRLENVSNGVYHRCDGVSSTQLKVAIESLMKYDAKYVSKTMPKVDEDDKPDHFKEGNLAHTLTLEPELVNDEYFSLPSDYKEPTEPQFKKYDEWVKLGKPSEKENKKAYPTALMLERCGRHYELMKEANDRCVIVNDSWKKAQAMANAVRNDEDCKPLVCNPALKTEVSYFKVDEVTGLLIKCRPDMELGVICADLKTISLRSSPDEDYLINALRREVYNRGYHVSAAMYMDIANLKQWIWVFVNKEEGYHWAAPIKASDNILYGDGEREGGYQIYRKYLEKIAECYKTGIWPKPESIRMKIDENGKRSLPEI